MANSEIQGRLEGLFKELDEILLATTPAEATEEEFDEWRKQLMLIGRRAARFREQVETWQGTDRLSVYRKARTPGSGKGGHIA